MRRDFPGGPVVKTLCRGHGFDPCSRNEDPESHVAWPKQTNKQTKNKAKQKRSRREMREKTTFGSLAVTRGKRGEYEADCGTQER